MPLLSLPNELLYMIAQDSLLDNSDLSNLCRTNLRLNTLLTPILLRSGGEDYVLLFASQRGFVNLAQNVLMLGAGVDAEDHDGCTALQWAARGGHKLVTKLLLQHGANVAGVDHRGWAALHWAAAEGNRGGLKATDGIRGVGHEAVASLLLDNLADINAKVGVKTTPLCLAIQSGNKATVKLLLRRGADISLGSVSWLQSLAPGSNEEGILRLLMEQDSRCDTTRIPDSEFSTPLLKAVSSGNEQVVKILLGRGVVLDEWASDDALQMAVTRGHKSIAILLLDSGLDINMTYGRRTLLHRTRCPELMALLLDRGAYVDARDSERQTPLHAMVGLKVDTAVITCISLLLAKGADLGARDIYVRTPLHCAVVSSTLEVVKLLIQNKACTAYQDDRGLTALHWASIVRRPDIVRLLVDAGADITVRFHNRWTLLHEIRHLSRVEINNCFAGWSSQAIKQSLYYRYTPEREQNKYVRATWEEVVKLLLDLGAITLFH